MSPPITFIPLALTVQDSLIHLTPHEKLLIRAKDILSMCEKSHSNSGWISCGVLSHSKKINGEWAATLAKCMHTHVDITSTQTRAKNQYWVTFTSYSSQRASITPYWEVALILWKPQTANITAPCEWVKNTILIIYLLLLPIGFQWAVVFQSQGHQSRDHWRIHTITKLKVHSKVSVSFHPFHGRVLIRKSLPVNKKAVKALFQDDDLAGLAFCANNKSCTLITWKNCFCMH